VSVVFRAFDDAMHLRVFVSVRDDAR
jgi:hypothetical protein